MSKKENSLIMIGTTTFVILIWYIASLKVNHLFIPDPVDVLNDAIQLIKNGKLFIHSFYTFRRVFIASCISGLISIPVGILIYNYEIPKVTIAPILSCMRYVPVTAFYPLLIMWVGIDERMKITFLFIAAFLFMMPSVILSLKEVPEGIMEAGKALGMTKVQRILYLQLTYSLPSIMESFIMCFAIGFGYCTVAETINAGMGLGYMIQQSSSRGKTDLVFLGIISITVISIIFDNASNKIIKNIFKWRY